MAEGGEDQENKTEEPTHKRLEDARKKGQIPSSRELNSLFIFLALGIFVMMISPHMMRSLTATLAPFITRPDDISSDFGNLRVVMNHAFLDTALLMIAPLLLFIVAALSAGGMQTRFNVSAESITPKLEKISPMKGISRLFSMKNLLEFIKGLIKITIVGIVAYMAVWPGRDRLHQLTNEDMNDITGFIMQLTQRMLIGIICIMALIAILDYLLQRFMFMKSMRMSKQEVKDEYKQQEGDPHIKQRLRAIRMERTRKRMMAQVPDADVVITNPTHFAVALKYDTSTMEAPTVVAKGVDKVAFRIREVAEEHKVMVMRNPPLARALYDQAELDKPIPFEYYQAVAQVIGYVYKLKGRVLRPPAKKR